MWGGWHCASLGWAFCESGMAVFGLVWLLGVAQRRLAGELRWATPAIRRSAYGAFCSRCCYSSGWRSCCARFPSPPR